MPAPQGTELANLAKTQFRTFSLKVPADWKQPQGDAGGQYSNAFADNEKSTNDDPSALFRAASTNKYHTDTQKKLNDLFSDYIDGICGAISTAWSQWQTAA